MNNTIINNINIKGHNLEILYDSPSPTVPSSIFNAQLISQGLSLTIPMTDQENNKYNITLDGGSFYSDIMQVYILIKILHIVHHIVIILVVKKRVYVIILIVNILQTMMDINI